MNPEKRRRKRHRYKAQERNKGYTNQAQRRALRAFVFARDGGVCQLCGGPLLELEMTLDRIDPEVRYSRWNVWASHRVCSERKGRRLVPRFVFRDVA